MEQFEPFVSAERIAEFLGRRQVVQMARTGALPAHPISGQKRHIWVFRISEVSGHIAERCTIIALGSPNRRRVERKA
jgi:hypothetical protein